MGYSIYFPIGMKFTCSVSYAVPTQGERPQRSCTCIGVNIGPGLRGKCANFRCHGDRHAIPVTHGLRPACRFAALIYAD
jgi:hypothetical protein